MIDKAIKIRAKALKRRRIRNIKICELLNLTKGQLRHALSYRKKPKVSPKIEGYQTDYRRKLKSEPYFVLKSKIYRFKYKIGGAPEKEFNLEDVLIKFGAEPTCALTGRKIDLNNGSAYHLDHITPRSKGGTNELKNMQIVCSQANIAKHTLSQEELLQLCRDILNHNKFGGK